jgi:putative tryptophan/tyrosine transport system substrate-binding protein
MLFLSFKHGRYLAVKRREFITLLGGAAAAWPLAARAQQPPKTAKVGILYPGMAVALPSRLAGLREGLRAAGHPEPDNIELLSRAADGDPKRIASLAMELAERKVDVTGRCACRASGERGHPNYRT